MSTDHGRDQPSRACNLVPGLVAGAAVIGMFVASLQNRGADASDELLAFVARVEAREAIERAPVERATSLVGPTERAVANTFYAAAIAGIESSKREFHELKVQWPYEGELPLQRDDVVRLRETWRAAMQDVVRGARCREVRLDEAWPWLLPVMPPIQFECACREQEGRVAECFELWLGTAQLLIDDRRGAWDRWALSTSRGKVDGLVQVWTERRLARLDTAHLQVLAAALGMLEEAIWQPFDIERMIAEVARRVTATDFNGGKEPDAMTSLRCWRTGFSLQQDAICRTLDWAQHHRSLGTTTASWSRRRHQLRRFEASEMASLADAVLDVERGLREAVTQLRLLRLSLSFRLGKPFDALPDPLGDGPLVVDDRGATIVIRSAGGAQRMLTR